MLSNIIGVLWIIGGIFWTIKPESLKKRLGRKLNRKMRRLIFGVLIVMGFSLIAHTKTPPKILPKLFL